MDPFLALPDPHALGVRSILEEAHAHARRGLLYQQQGSELAAASSFVASKRLIDKAADVASRAPPEVRVALFPYIARARAAASPSLFTAAAPLGLSGLGEQWAGLPPAVRLVLIGVAVWLAGRWLRAW